MGTLLFWFFLIGLMGAVIYVILDSIVFVPAVHYGVVWRFGGQIAGTLNEGFNLKIPFIDTVKMASLALETNPIKVQFTTIDKLRLIIPGSLQFRADKTILEEEKTDQYGNVVYKGGKNVFVRISDEAIVVGVEKDIQAKLGGIGGKYEAEEFIENRQALADLINSILRLEKPLHLNHIRGNIDWCGFQGCEYGEKIDADKLIEFYNDHWKKVKAILDNEKNHIEDHSEIERRYGIDIVAYSLAEVDFTPETQAAQEEKKQAEYRAEAGTKIIKLSEDAKKILSELSDQQALNWADSTLNPGTPRQMISVEGEVGIAGGLLGLVPKPKSKKSEKD